MKKTLFSAAAATLFLSACDRHQWEGEDGVKELYKHHDEDHGSHDGHAKDGEESHGMEKGHGADKSHGQEKAH